MDPLIWIKKVIFTLQQPSNFHQSRKVGSEVNNTLQNFIETNFLYLQHESAPPSAQFFKQTSDVAGLF